MSNALAKNLATLMFDCGKSVGMGYSANFLSKSIEESDWQLVRKPGGDYYCYFSVAADGTVRVDNENSLTGIQSIISAPSQSAPSAIYSLDGRKVTSASSSKVVIMKRGDDVRKVIKRQL